MLDDNKDAEELRMPEEETNSAESKKAEETDKIGDEEENKIIISKNEEEKSEDNKELIKPEKGAEEEEEGIGNAQKSKDFQHAENSVFKHAVSDEEPSTVPGKISDKIGEKLKIDWSNKKLWLNIFLVVALIAIIFLGTYIRTTNISQLKDVTTESYTLGPDLDPFLFLRHAKEITENNLQDPDMMRAAPLGAKNYAKANLMPWAIVFIYKIFMLESIEFAGIIAPVLFFGLTLIAFFFFIKKLFSFMPGKKSVFIALISTAFYAVIPVMQHRTTAGIPEIESLGMIFFWLAFLFFTSAWYSNKIKKTSIFSALSGIFTGIMIFSWGGFKYIFMTFALASFLMFLFNKEKKRNFWIYCLWLIPSLIFALAKEPRLLIDIGNVGFALAIFSILLVDMVIFRTKLKEKLKIKKIKLPESIISIIILIALGLLALVIFKPELISQIISKVIEGLIYPFGRGRVGATVAENRPPYFAEVLGNFGKSFFWLFFIGTLFLFYEATKHFNVKNKIPLNLCFIIFLSGFIFSRLSQGSFLNGENFISKFLYFGGLLLFVIVTLSLYIKAHIRDDEKTLNDFREINFSYFLLLAFIFWMIVSMRGAIRLFFIISPAMIMAISFLPVKLSEYCFKTKEVLYKIGLWCAVAIIIIFLITNFISYEKSTAYSAKYTIPSVYNHQWQKAMEWVREETPENAIFVHWWDYGYWVQTWGERATVTDGGHEIGYWDHLTGRYLLTAQNEKTALQLCKAYNVSYLLIDSTDIGKYSAYSSIGSDKGGGDRLGWVSTFINNEKETQEFRNETIYVYTGGTILDQDVVWNGQLFPASKAGIVAFALHIDKETGSVNNVDAIFFYNKKQTRIPIRYVWIDNKKIDLKKEEKVLESMLYIIPRLSEDRINNIGAGLYLNEKALSTQWVRLYLLNETSSFELAHQEDAFIINQIKDAYDINIGDFIYANNLHGPIKIWKVDYPDDIEYHEEYLKTSGDWAGLDYLGI